MKNTTYINLDVEGRRKSWTYHAEPDDPFELIDVEEAKKDYGEIIDFEMREFNKRVESLFNTFRYVKGNIEVRIDTGRAYQYGSLTDKQIAAILTSLTVPNATCEFRTRREALESILNLLLCLMKRIPEDQRPDSLEAIEKWQTRGVYFYNPEYAVEYRLTALALNLIGDSIWCECRDSEDKEFDEYGVAILSITDDEERQRLLTGTEDRCIGCRRKKSEAKNYVQLNNYTFLCDECAKACYEITLNEKNARFHQMMKGTDAVERRAMEKLSQSLQDNEETQDDELLKALRGSH